MGSDSDKKAPRWLDSLYRTYGQELRGVFASELRSREEADDLVQEIFYRVAKRFRSHPDTVLVDSEADGIEEKAKNSPLRPNPRAYLYKVGYNLVRKKWRARPAVPEGSFEGLQNVDQQSSPFNDTEYREQLMLLRDAMSKLLLSYQTGLRLWARDGSYAEIAEVLGIPRASVGSFLSQGKKKLDREFQALLKGEGNS